MGLEHLIFAGVTRLLLQQLSHTHFKCFVHQKPWVQLLRVKKDLSDERVLLAKYTLVVA